MSNTQQTINRYCLSWCFVVMLMLSEFDMMMMLSLFCCCDIRVAQNFPRNHLRHSTSIQTTNKRGPSFIDLMIGENRNQKYLEMELNTRVSTYCGTANRKWDKMKWNEMKWIKKFWLCDPIKWYPRIYILERWNASVDGHAIVLNWTISCARQPIAHIQFYSISFF